MNNLYETSILSMPMLLTLLLVVIWNLIKRISCIGSLSKLLLMVSLSLLCLLWIGEFMERLSVTVPSKYQIEAQGFIQTESPLVKINPFIDMFPSLMAAFLILSLMGAIIYADECPREAIEKILGLSPPKQRSDGKEPINDV